MKTGLDHQHEIDGDLSEWAKTNGPSPLVKALIVAYLALGGIFPYGGHQMGSAIFPIIIITIGGGVSHYLHPAK